MSERLEEIDRIVEGLYNDKIELRNFVQESLEQAERAKGMQEIVDILQISNDEWYEQNKRYREALEFYLSKNNWDEGRVYLDGGYRAWRVRNE